jgi:hypothetical protein
VTVVGAKKRARKQAKRVERQLAATQAMIEQLEQDLTQVATLQRTVTDRLERAVTATQAHADSRSSELVRRATASTRAIEAAARRVDERATDVLRDLDAWRNAAEERITRAAETAIAHIDEQTTAHGRRAEEAVRNCDELDRQARELVARACARLDEIESVEQRTEVLAADAAVVDEPADDWAPAAAWDAADAAAADDAPVADVVEAAHDETIADEPATHEPDAGAATAELGARAAARADEPGDDPPGADAPADTPADAVPASDTPPPVVTWNAPEPPASSAERAAVDQDPVTAVGTLTDPLAEPPRPWPRSRTAAAVTVEVGAAQLEASLDSLARNAAGGWVRAELTFDSLRLTVLDASGWWEHHDLAVRGGQLERAAATVDLAELIQAVELERARTGGDVVTMEFDGNIAVGTTLALARADALLPTGARRKIARIELRGKDPNGLVLDTEVGRLVVPSRLVSLLRSRRATAVDVVIVGERTCLVAPLADVATDVHATILAPLADPEIGADPTQGERRDDARSPIQDLVGALSCTSTPEELRAILATGAEFARRRAIAHPAVPVELLVDALEHGDDSMRVAAATNPSIPDDALQLAMRDPESVVRAAAVANPRVTPAQLDELADDPTVEVRIQVARHAALPEDVLVRLADDPASAVRATVAGFETVPPEILARLATDPDPAVCGAVAENPCCPLELLDTLVGVVPESVLANPRAPEHLLQAGVQVKSPPLRAAVAANPSTPARLLDVLSHDPSEAVRTAVAEHPNASARARRRARKQPSARAAV